MGCKQKLLGSTRTVRLVPEIGKSCESCKSSKGKRNSTKNNLKQNLNYIYALLSSNLDNDKCCNNRNRSAFCLLHVVGSLAMCLGIVPGNWAHTGHFGSPGVESPPLQKWMVGQSDVPPGSTTSGDKSFCNPANTGHSTSDWKNWST